MGSKMSSRNDTLTLAPDEIDSFTYGLYVDAFFSHDDKYYGHPNGCRCGRHGGVTLPMERWHQPEPIEACYNDLRQFSTPGDVAEGVAKSIRALVPLGYKFVDLCAGNGILSAKLLKLGYSGSAVELDAGANLYKLYSLKYRLPFGTNVPFDYYYCNVMNFRERTNFVVMNPPFKTQFLYDLLDHVFTITGVVFVLLPSNLGESQYYTDKKDGVIKERLTPFQQRMKKRQIRTFAIDNYTFPLPRTKGWHKESCVDLQVTLFCLIKTGSTTFGLENLLAESLGLPAKLGSYGCIRGIEGSPYNMPANEAIPTKIPLGNCPGYAAHWTTTRAVSQLFENDHSREEVMVELPGPHLEVKIVEKVDGEYVIHYGKGSTTSILTFSTTRYPFFVNAYGPMAANFTPNEYAWKSAYQGMLTRHGIPLEIRWINLIALRAANEREESFETNTKLAKLVPTSWPRRPNYPVPPKPTYTNVVDFAGNF